MLLFNYPHIVSVTTRQGTQGGQVESSEYCGKAVGVCLSGVVSNRTTLQKPMLSCGTCTCSHFTTLIPQRYNNSATHCMQQAVTNLHGSTVLYFRVLVTVFGFIGSFLFEIICLLSLPCFISKGRPASFAMDQKSDRLCHV